MTDAGTAAVAGTDDLRDWLAAAVGGTVTEWRRLLSGNSRTTWSADVSTEHGAVKAVVRVDEGDGPFSGTPLTLAREAAVYGALQGSDVRIPRIYGFNARLNALALERCTGTPAWDDDVLDALLVELARLHALDADEIPLAGFERSAAADLELWATIAERRIAPRSPLIDFALTMLQASFPGEPDRLVLLHGDPGPGNVLCRDTTITALLDWEMTHFGDPHDDLAYVTVRAALHETRPAEFGRRVGEHYVARTGLALDDERLRYWQAVGVLRNLISCEASVSNPVRGRDKLVHLILIPPLKRLMVQALARLIDVELEPTTPPQATTDLPGGDVLREIADGLGMLVGAIPDEGARQRARRMRYLLSQLAQTWTAAFEIARADEIDATPAPDVATRLRQLSRMADRHLALFPRARGIGSVELPGFEGR